MHPISRTQVKELAQYDIDIQGLQHKQYVFNFKSGNAFFEELDQELISKGDIETLMTLTKSAIMLVLDLKIKGQVELTCDRSLALFYEPFDLSERLILKFGEQNDVLSDEMEVIKSDTSRINLAHTIFEYIAVSLPMKKLHPRFRNDDSDEEILIYSSIKKEDIEEENIDPRWAKLKQFNN